MSGSESYIKSPFKTLLFKRTLHAPLDQYAAPQYMNTSKDDWFRFKHEVSKKTTGRPRFICFQFGLTMEGASSLHVCPGTEVPVTGRASPRCVAGCCLDISLLVYIFCNCLFQWAFLFVNMCLFTDVNIPASVLHTVYACVCVCGCLCM